MAENTQGVSRLVERMALFTEAIDEMFPTGKKMVIIELSNHDFTLTKLNFGNNDFDTDQFRVDMSGLEFIFIRDGLLNVSSNKS